MKRGTLANMNSLVVSKLRRAASPSNLSLQDLSLRSIIDNTTARRADSFRAPSLKELNS